VVDMRNTGAPLDLIVRHYIYDHVIQEGLPPTIVETALALSCTHDEVRASFNRLSAAHILVLQREIGEILMANPFSAVPTPFRVLVGQRAYYGNCIWDAMGIPAMLKQDAVIQASCSCCGSAMSLKITGGSLEPAPGLAHFAIPAAHWWDNIVFT
jgi:hypothetical protein